MNKYLLIVLPLLLLAFALGRYSSPKQVSTSETQTVDNTIKHTVIVKAPDGHEVTTIDEHTVEHQIEKKASVIISKRNVYNVSALAGTQLTHGIQPIYGVSVSKEFIGPIVLGAFGLNNGIVGVSIGVNF